MKQRSSMSEASFDDIRKAFDRAIETFGPFLRRDDGPLRYGTRPIAPDLKLGEADPKGTPTQGCFAD